MSIAHALGAVGGLWLAIVAGPAAAAPGLDVEPDCRAALQALSRQESAAPAGQPAPAALLAARRDAVQACLGAAEADPPSPAPARHPERLPSIVPVLPPASAPAPPPRTRPDPITHPPPPRAAPQSLGACDALGCFDGQGRRLHRSNGQLIGPTGLCSVQGGIPVCPG